MTRIFFSYRLMFILKYFWIYELFSTPRTIIIRSADFIFSMKIFLRVYNARKYTENTELNSHHSVAMNTKFSEKLKKFLPKLLGSTLKKWFTNSIQKQHKKLKILKKNTKNPNRFRSSRTDFNYYVLVAWCKNAFDFFFFLQIFMHMPSTFFYIREKINAFLKNNIKRFRKVYEHVFPIR